MGEPVGDRLETRVARVVQETPVDRTFVLPVPPEARARFGFRPGQHVMIADPEADPAEERPYSLSGSPDRPDALEVTVRGGRGFGDRLYRFEPGRRVLLSPPQGDFVLEAAPGERLLLLAGGSGIAPFRALLRGLRAEGRSETVVLVASAREPGELLFHEELLEHATACRWLRYVPTVTRWPPPKEWEGRRGRVEAVLFNEILTEPGRTRLYACGPTAFVDAVRDLAARGGLTASRVRTQGWG